MKCGRPTTALYDHVPCSKNATTAAGTCWQHDPLRMKGQRKGRRMTKLRALEYVAKYCKCECGAVARAALAEEVKLRLNTAWYRRRKGQDSEIG